MKTSKIPLVLLCLLSVRAVGLPQSGEGTFFMESYLIYFHRKADTKEIFYVGQSNALTRAHSARGRNYLWKRTVAKHGFIVEIKENGLDKTQVDSREEYYINLYGRIDIKTGCLVNLTSGGYGSRDVRESQETRNKKSISHLGKKASDEHKRNISIGNTGKKKTLTLEQRELLSQRLKLTHTGRIKTQKEIELLRLSKLGKPRPQWLKDHLSKIKSKPVILIKDTAIIEFPSVTSSTEYLQCSRKEVCRAIKLNRVYKGFNIYYL